MLLSHPIFAMSHVTAMIKHKKELKKQNNSNIKEKERKNDR